eukprot:9614206-Karenia_brevis.AAC.1
MDSSSFIIINDSSSSGFGKPAEVILARSGKWAATGNPATWASGRWDRQVQASLGKSRQV